MPEDDGALRVDVTVRAARSGLASEHPSGVLLERPASDRPPVPVLPLEHRDAGVESRVEAPFVLKVSLVCPEQRGTTPGARP